MSRGAQLRVSKTKTIPVPNEYIQALYGEFGAQCFDEEAAPMLKGKWREVAFGIHDDRPLDLEIGTGNGTHFAHQSYKHPDRLWLGIELKYKPLIQSIRRSVRNGSTNSRMARYNAVLAHELFAVGELNNAYIHFPDPWSKLRQHKHRLLQVEFLNRLWTVQRPGSFVEIKMDHREYFEWTLARIAESRYKLEHSTFDLHHSPYVADNFATQFENIFLREGKPIHLARLLRE